MVFAPTGAFTVVQTSVDSEDAAASGWSILDDRHQKEANEPWETRSDAMRIAVHGFAPLSDDATLSGLVLNDGTRDVSVRPAFAADKLDYEVRVPLDVARVTVTPTASEPTAAVAYVDRDGNELADADAVADGQKVDLAVGSTVVGVRVTAPDRMNVRTYTVAVTRADTLVSNLSLAPGNNDLDIRAQSFRTGAQARGYTVVDVRVRTGTVSDFSSRRTVVTIRRNQGDEPGGLVATLSNPDPLRASAANRFAAPAGTMLEPGRTYWVTVNEGVNSGANRTPFRIDTANADSGEPGWSIGNDSLVWQSGDWDDRNSSLVMAVAGVVDPFSAEDGATMQTYTVTVTRATPQSACQTGDVWCDTMSEGTWSSLGTIRGYGYYQSLSVGSFSNSNEFAHEGDDYRVAVLVVTTGGVLQLDIQRGNTTSASEWAGFVLYADGEPFAVNDAAISAGRIRWSGSGLGWSGGDTVEVRLAEAAANNPATGAPTVSGHALLGHTLTAGAGDIDDADGLPSTTFPDGFSFQWLRVDALDVETAIPDATAATYTAAAEDLGGRLRVAVSFDHGAGFRETAASEATAAVAVPPGCQAADVWCATLTVGALIFGAHLPGLGYILPNEDLPAGIGALTDTGFSYGGTDYGIVRILVATSTDDLEIAFNPDDGDAVFGALALYVDGPLLTLRYAEPLDAGSTPGPKDWVVAASSAAGTRTLAVTAVSVAGAEVALLLSPPALAGESVSVSYLPWAMHPLLLGRERVEAAPGPGGRLRAGRARGAGPVGQPDRRRPAPGRARGPAPAEPRGQPDRGRLCAGGAGRSAGAGPVRQRGGGRLAAGGTDRPAAAGPVREPRGRRCGAWRTRRPGGAGAGRQPGRGPAAGGAAAAARAAGSRGQPGGRRAAAGGAGDTGAAGPFRQPGRRCEPARRPVRAGVAGPFWQPGVGRRATRAPDGAALAVAGLGRGGRDARAARAARNAS